MQIQSGCSRLVEKAVAAVAAGDFTAILDEIPAPIYVTDRDGVITYFNPACIGFTGRLPVSGKDRWCVTWKLYTADGEPLPHDRCPMAEAIKSGRPNRHLSAVAERPDGTRVAFMPFPTPLLSDSGEVLGAVNMLIDVTEPEQAQELRDQAARCRRLANAANDASVSRRLEELALEYDAAGALLDRARKSARPPG